MLPRIFIFEGLDGCGKSTQCCYLKDNLQKQGVDCFIVREPGGTLVGEYIRSWLKNDDTLTPEKQLLLFCLSRKEMCDFILDTILNTNKTIILDRFVLSTYAYQGLKISKDMIQYYLNDICPRYKSILGIAQTIYLDITPEIALERINVRNEKKDSFETLENLEKIHSNYSQLINSKIWKINANQSQEDVFKEIEKHLIGIV